VFGPSDSGMRRDRPQGERVDHSVAERPVIIRIARRKLRIRSVAIERTAKLSRHLATDRKIGRVGLEGDGREMGGEVGVLWESLVDNT
jgi:hypothetical protein